MSDLFRSQVVKRQTNRLHGDILILPRISHTVILGLLLLWLVIAVMWLATSTYARKETIFGWLEPSEGVTKIYAKDTGVIKQVLVREGDTVLEEQPLIIVNGDRILADGETLENRLLNEYVSQQSFLNEQLNHITNIYHLRQLDIDKQIITGKQDIILLEDQTKILQLRLNLAKEHVERHQNLRSRGFVSETDLENIIAQELALRNERQALMRELINRRNNIEQLHSELLLLPDQRSNEIMQLRTRLSDVAQKIAQLYGQRSYIVKATKQGQVNNLQVKIGQQVYGGSEIPLMTLIPNNSELSAHLLVPVRSAGFIEPGQALDIRYDSFPYQKFGLYRGEVVSISDTVLMPNELLNTPLRIDEPVFRILAYLQQHKVHAFGREFLLKPGTTLSADVRLDERTLLQWLLEPIYSMRGRL
ncbi:MAG: hypothetical protein A3H98_03990 [Bacteroidetes bacterium RIFCSPLOWO2_02_FULL_36_8]|nr:MAG: hypothetical protein A3H98_03990 [Bacteroidetes bacterium RIFCSPLOWO2_02_FULL_36_8]